MLQTVFILVLWLSPSPNAGTLGQPRITTTPFTDTMVMGKVISAQQACDAAITYWLATAPNTILEAKCFGPAIAK